MTLKDIAERLKAEFPTRYVSINLEANYWPNRQYTPETTTAIRIYSEGAGHIEAVSLEDAIAKLRAKLVEVNSPKVEPDIAISDIDAAPPTGPEPTHPPTQEQIAAMPVANSEPSEPEDVF